MLLRPAAAWGAVHAADPPWSATLLRHVAPLALLPALAWPLGQVQAGVLPASPGVLAAAWLATFAFSLLSVVFLAAGFYLLAGFFDLPRTWHRSMAVAGYAATPVLLCGALLVVPVLVIASLGGLLYTFGLCFLGVQRVLGCPEESAAAYIAAACTLALVASMATGALCSAAGLI